MNNIIKVDVLFKIKRDSGWTATVFTNLNGDMWVDYHDAERVVKTDNIDGKNLVSETVADINATLDHLEEITKPGIKYWYMVYYEAVNNGHFESRMFATVADSCKAAVGNLLRWYKGDYYIASSSPIVKKALVHFIETQHVDTDMEFNEESLADSNFAPKELCE